MAAIGIWNTCKLVLNEYGMVWYGMVWYGMLTITCMAMAYMGTWTRTCVSVNETCTRNLQV